MAVIPKAFQDGCDDPGCEWPTSFATATGFPLTGDYHDCYVSATCRAVEEGKSRFFFLKGESASEPEDCQLTAFSETLVGPGVFTDVDFGAAGPIVSIMFIPTADTLTGSLVAQSGDAVTLSCGGVKGWQTVVDPETNRLCPLTGFTVTLLAGDTVEVIGQHI